MSTGRDIVNISSCLEQVKLTNALLIAIVSDGHSYRDLFDSEQVKTILSETNAITFDIAYPSQLYTQFAEFYRLGAPPLISFIAANGFVVEAIRGEISQEHFAKIFKFALSNIGRGIGENQVYYPFNGLVNLPVPKAKQVPVNLPVPKAKHVPVEEIKIEKQTINKDKQNLANPDEAVVTKRQTISSNCRIKFVLQNGSNISNTFEPTATLADLKHFLRDRIPGLKDVTIIRPHPREAFQPNQDLSTLQELDIRTGSRLIVHNVTSDIAKFSIQAIYTAILSFFAAIWAYFFPLRRNQIPIQSNSPTNTGSNSLRQNAQSNSTKRGIARPGNMFRLSDLRDKDDESNTYNGNSTQQQ